MARCLIAIIRAEHDRGEEWIHVNKTLIYYGISAAASEYSKLAGWGLIESRGDSKDSTPSAGYWRPTPLGRRFAYRQVLVQKYLFCFDGRFLGLDGDQVDIVDALGSHFNYADLMAGL